MTPEEIEADADATARWEEAVGWTAPEEGIPGAGIPPFPLDGAADEWFLKLIDESPDVRATRVSMGNAWLQIYSGSHPECGTFTVLIEEHKYVRGAIEEAYVVSNGTLMCDNINFWYEGSLRAQQM